MVTKKKPIFIAGAVALILIGIISYRIYSNMAANKERAGRASQGRAVAVEVGVVAKRDINPIVNFSASLEPTWSADISSKVDGRIDFLGVNEGDMVRAGAVIATLDTNELAAQVVQAEGSMYSARANFEQAELDLKRTEALAKQGAVSVQALDTARIKRDLAIGQLRSAEGNVDLLRARLDNATITAPRHGVIVKRYLQSGYYAKTGAPIVSLADTTELLAKATVGEGQVSELAIGTKVKVKIDALGNKEFTGTITRISPAAAVPSRTFTAEVAIPNAEGVIKAGMFAKVEAPARVRKNVIVVPEGALVMREDQKTIYVVNAENKVQQKVLTLGYVGDGWAEVLGGVQEGERIVVAGQNKLKDGASISVPAGEGGK